MDKKHKQNLIITLVCTIVVGVSLFFFYDNFKFHTYSDVTYYDYLLRYSSDDLTIDNYEVNKNKSNSNIGGGTLTILNNTIFTNDSDLVFEVTLENDDKDKVIYSQDIHYLVDTTKYDLATIDEENVIDNVSKASFAIYLNTQEVYSDDLKLVSVDPIYASNKDYRIDGACISSYYMRLGYLTTTNKSIIVDYPNVSLEYRYLKDKKGDEDDDNNYVVFKKITGKSKDIVNVASSGAYVQEKEDGSLKKKDLSVVVIFSKDNSDKTYAFKMEFSKEAGEVNE